MQAPSNGKKDVQWPATRIKGRQLVLASSIWLAGLHSLSLAAQELETPPAVRDTFGISSAYFENNYANNIDYAQFVMDVYLHIFSICLRFFRLWKSRHQALDHRRVSGAQPIQLHQLARHHPQMGQRLRMERIHQNPGLIRIRGARRQLCRTGLGHLQKLRWLGHLGESQRQDHGLGELGNRVQHAHEQKLEAAKSGLADIVAGRTQDADTALAEIQKRRMASAKSLSKGK